MVDFIPAESLSLDSNNQIINILYEFTFNILIPIYNKDWYLNSEIIEYP